MGGVNNCWLGFSLSPNLAVDLQESTQSASASSNSMSNMSMSNMSMSMVHSNHNPNVAFARDNTCYEVVSSSHNVDSPEITTLRSDGSLFILDRSQPQEWQTRSMVTGSELQSQQHLINADLSMLVGGRNDSSQYEHHNRHNRHHHHHHHRQQEGPKLEDFLGGASLGGEHYSESRNETRQTSMESLYGAAQSFNVGEQLGMKMMLTDPGGRLFSNFDMADSELSATDDSKPCAEDESLKPPHAVGAIHGSNLGESYVPNSTDYVFPDCSLQLPQASALHNNSSTTNNNNSNSGINGLSMIKTWLTSQPCSAESKMKIGSNSFGASTSCSTIAATAGEGKEGFNALQSLSLSMSPTSQSTTSMAIVPLPSEDALLDSSESKKRALVLSDKPTSSEPALRKSIDTFGQRTSIYRGVTRHRWTGRYEAHLWDNSCRREGQTRKGRQVYLGGYDKEEKAARAYDLAALKYWGPTTTTNFPISNYEKELEEMKHMTRQEYVASLRRKSSGFSRGASMYRGVTRHHQHGRWQARIGRVAGNKDLYLGTFSTQEEAAEAYDIAAIKFRGLNAVTNFDMSRYDVKSILASSTLPVGGHVKRIKEAEPSDPSVEARHHDEDSTLSSYAAISYNNAASKQEWPIIAAFQNHHASQQARAWCKQEQGTQNQHDLQVQLQSFHNQKFYQPHFANATVLHNLMSLESPSPVDNTNNNSTGSTSALYSNISTNNLLSNGIVMASAPTIQSGAVTLVSENNQTRAPFGQNEHGNLKAYENMSMYGDPYARGLYYLPQQPSGNMKANYDPNVAATPNRSSTRWLVKEDEESAGINANNAASSVEARKLTGKSPGGSFGEEKSKIARRRKKKKKDDDGNLPDLLLAGSDLMISTFLGGNLPNHTEAEQVAAGWPAWLTAVAGEAIKGWIPRKADSFEKLYKIGQGTYSNVYKARDLDTGKIVALKKVRFDNLEPESVRFMAREIQVLRRLDHPNVVKLEGLVTSGVSCSLYLVFEYMEHDLAGLAACPGIKFTEAQVKCYMQQLLCGLDHCHSRGVLHRDIKGSNLLVDNGGILKIADFGLATFFHPDQRQALTSRVVTLWYRPPELLLGATDYGVAVDLWSTGCILAELLSGKPIMPGRTEVEQLHKIFKLCGSPSEEYWRKSKLPHATIFKPQHPYKCCIAEAFKDFPPSVLVLLETLLAIEPADRGRADGALQSEFFTTKPLPCDPSSLPKYPPSKEFDAKIRAEEARRQRAAGGRGHGPEAARRVSKLPRAGPTPDGASELMAPAQKQRPSSHRTSNIRNENSNPQPHELLIDPQRSVQHSYETTTSASHVTPVIARSGPLLYAYGSGSTATFGKMYKEDSKDKHPGQTSVQSSKLPVGSDLKTQGIYGQPPAGDLSKAAKLAAGRKYDVMETCKDQYSLLQQNLADSMGGLQNGKHEGSRIPDISAKQHLVQQQRPESLKRLDSFQQDMSGLYPQRDERLASREPFMGYGRQEERILYSGPLLPPSANIDDILKKHERNIQRAVRRARQGKGETIKNDSSFSGRKAFEQKSLVSNPKGYKGSSDLKGELTTSLIDTRRNMKSGLTKDANEEE